MADLTKPTEADHTSPHRQEVDKPGCKTFFTDATSEVLRCQVLNSWPFPKVYVVDPLHSEGLQLLNTRELALKAAQEIFQGLPLFPSWPKKCKGIVFVGKQQSNKYSLCAKTDTRRPQQVSRPDGGKVTNQYVLGPSQWSQVLNWDLAPSTTVSTARGMLAELGA